MQQIRIQKRHTRHPYWERDALPLDPRDSDIVKAKRLQQDEARQQEHR
jgi:hypothetical protein